MPRTSTTCSTASDVARAGATVRRTAAFFARFNERATEHERARRVFQGIHSGELRYAPLFTSRYVLTELGTLMLRKVGHRPAVNALATIREADSFNVLAVDGDVFDRTCTQFGRYDDQQISFVDHSSAVLAADRGMPVPRAGSTTASPGRKRHRPNCGSRSSPSDATEPAT